MNIGLGISLYQRPLGANFQGILDQLSTASSAAYSLRKLRSAYSGSAIRVRRSSDNTETDIGFTSAGELDQTALLDFVNANVISFPLDGIAASSASFSLRKLRSAYTGAAIRVRRSSDNTESDIGFDANGNLDQSTLLAFVGSGSGFVTIWYDQSGNGVNTTQATAANQPRIVLNGVVDNLNGKVSIVTENATSFLSGTLNVNGLTGITLSAVGRNPNTGQIADNRPSFFAWSEVGSWGKVFFTNNQTQIGWRFGTGQTSNSRTANATKGSGLGVFTLLKNSTLETPYLNGTALTPFTGALTTTANNGTNFKLFAGDNSTSQAGLYMSEAIIFRTALNDANRTTLESNQLYYYLNQNNGFVTIWYDQSGNSVNAIQATASNQPRIVLNGVLDTYLGKPTMVNVTGSQRLQTSNITRTQENGTYSAVVQAAARLRFMTLASDVSSEFARFTDNNSYPMLGRTARTGPVFANVPNTGGLVYCQINNAVNHLIYNNNALGGTIALSGTRDTLPRPLVIGATVNGEPKSAILEAMLFLTNIPDTDRSLLATNQGAFYSITVNP